MSNFSILLKSAISMNDISNRSLSMALNLDRTRLQKILSGDRMMVYSTLEALFSRLSLPKQLNEALRYSFAKEHYGSDAYNNIEFTISRLCEMHQFQEKMPDLNPELYSNSAFMKKVNNIIQQELAMAEPLIYTNFSFQQQALRTYFLNILRSKDRYIDFRHIHLNSLDDTTQKQIDNYLCAFEFAGYGYNTYGYSIHNPCSISLLTPLPFFIITRKSALLFSKNQDFFIEEQTPKGIESMRQYFEKIYSVCIPFANNLETPEDFSNFLSVMTTHQTQTDINTTTLFDMSRNVCAASFLTNEILNESLPETYLYKEYLANGIGDFYQNFRKFHISFMFDHDSLFDFMNDDSEICDYHYITLDGLSLSPQHKLTILQSFYDYLTSNLGEGHLLNTSLIQFPDYFHLNVIPGGFTLGFNFKTYNPETKQLALSVASTMDPILYKNFLNFSEFMIHSPYIYSHEHTCAVWKNALEYYKSSHNLS